MGDRGPRQIVGVLALDQVGPEALERRAHRAVAQQQPVMRASRHMRRRDRHGDRAVLLDDLVARAGDDHQMAVRRRFEDVPALVQQIGAHAAADFGPALGQVAEQPRRPAARADRDRRGSLRYPTRRRATKCHRPCSGAELSEYFTQSPLGPSPVRQKTAEISHFFELARPLLHYSASTWFHANEGAVQRFSGPAAPPLLHFRPAQRPRRPAAAARRSRTSPS